eukprot:TRINITY_DN13577_c0_g1_i1.p1 TRINITY_DN13577_c0_g1~~TRINITY_DN13577_c0_g1_i1.p1  ORF type:complete len:136 (-),score=24.39 TRINITY_DN13577_c0_g1_i1:104-511(-)
MLSAAEAREQSRTLAEATRQARLSTCEPLPTELDLYKRQRQAQRDQLIQTCKSRGLTKMPWEEEEEQFRSKYLKRRQVKQEMERLRLEKLRSTEREPQMSRSAPAGTGAGQTQLQQKKFNLLRSTGFTFTNFYRP